MVVRQTLANKVFAIIWNAGFRGELDSTGVQDSLIPHDSHLWFVMAKWFNAEKQLIENDSHAPDINLNKKIMMLDKEAYGRGGKQILTFYVIWGFLD